MLRLSDQELVTLIIYIIVGGSVLLMILAIVLMLVEGPFHRLKAIQKLIKEWDEKQGHSKCWYYPEIFKQIADEAQVKLTNHPPNVPRPQFREQCHQYEEEQYNSDKRITVLP